MNWSVGRTASVTFGVKPSSFWFVMPVRSTRLPLTKPAWLTTFALALVS